MLPSICHDFLTRHGHPNSRQERAQGSKHDEDIFKDIGVPPYLIADGDMEQVQGESLRLANQSGCQIVELEKGTPNTNRPKRYIQMLNNETKRDLLDSNILMVFWCYCVERRAHIINATVQENYLLQQETPHSKITGRPCDISDLCGYGWYEWVKYRCEGRQFTFPS